MVKLCIFYGIDSKVPKSLCHTLCFTLCTFSADSIKGLFHNQLRSTRPPLNSLGLVRLMNLPRMISSNTTQVSAIASPVVIVICIAGAVVLVIIIAAVYRLCRRIRADANDSVEEKPWNPNLRNTNQDKYMEEVRWRNNATAWESAKADDGESYRRGWFRECLEEQRAQQTLWTPVSLNGPDANGVPHPYDASPLVKE